MFSPRELSFFEKLFEMESGYVLDFSRDGLKNFIRDSVNLDVFTVDYLNYVKRRFGTDSMSNVLKYFWETEDFNKTLKSCFCKYYTIRKMQRQHIDKFFLYPLDNMIIP